MRITIKKAHAFNKNIIYTIHIVYPNFVFFFISKSNRDKIIFFYFIHKFSYFYYWKIFERKKNSIDTSLSRFVVHRLGLGDIYFDDMVDEQRNSFSVKCENYEEKEQNPWNQN